MEKNLKKIIILIAAFFFLYLITKGINFPYVGPNAWNYNTYSLIARNYNSFGYFETKFAPVISVSEKLPDKPEYYLHHPQLLSIIESFLFKFFGEDFWVGRLTVIIFSIGSGLLLFLIAKKMKGINFAITSVIVYTFIPASSIFGRMIGQEPLVLFFILLSIFALINYLKNNKKIYLIIYITSLILGVLSDWPMVYFSFILILYLIYKKRYKLIFLNIFLPIFTVIIFFIYIFNLLGSFSDLKMAFLVRSLGELLTLEFWPLRWFFTILIRFLLYFNPIFVFLAFIYLVKAFFDLKSKKPGELTVLIFILFSFSFFHIILYPEGSFGHPYWTYYSTPFIVYSSSMMFLKIYNKRKYFWLITIFLFSLLFLVKIEDWKTKEMQVNIWRYELAKKINNYLIPYEEIIMNTDSVIDPDIFQYSFLHKTQMIKTLNEVDLLNNKYYINSCFNKCDLLNNKFNNRYLRIKSSEGEAIIFFLTEKEMNKSETKSNFEKEEKIDVVSLPYQENSIKKIYIFLKNILKTPQI